MNVGQKAGYVRAKLGGPTGGHTCHWPGCTKQVPPAVWGCAPHWYSLPLDLRRKVWRAFRPGQEITKTPGRDYAAVAREVQRWIEENAK